MNILRALESCQYVCVSKINLCGSIDSFDRERQNEKTNAPNGLNSTHPKVVESIFTTPFGWSVVAASDGLRAKKN